MKTKQRTLAEILDRARGELDMTVEDFAKAIGIHRSQLYKLRIGAATPTDRTLHRIARFLEVDIDDVRAAVLAS